MNASSVQIFKDGWHFEISGGVIAQDAGQSRIHVGFVNNKEVTWLDFGESHTRVTRAMAHKSNKSDDMQG